MLRWLGNKKAPEPPPHHSQLNPKMLVEQNQQQQQQQQQPEETEEITDDPLATFETSHRGPKPIYSVSRSVLLPRVTLKNTIQNTALIHVNERGVNPLFQETEDEHQASSPTTKTKPTAQCGGKSNSSGYGGSNGECSTSFDPLYLEQSKLRDDVITILEQNPNFIKSICLATKFGRNNCNNSNNNNNNNNKSVPSLTSGSSTAGGTLTTIPEGRVDLPVPKPIWPQTIVDQNRTNYDSIVDDALLFYTSLNNVPDNCRSVDNNRLDVTVKEILVELLNKINATIAGNTGLTSEEMLKIVNEKIAGSIEVLKISTEEEMRKLCINLSNCHKINSVLRAFNNSPSSSTSSGNSSQSSPEWNNNRSRTASSEIDDIYQIPSGSSSSGFSDYLKENPSQQQQPKQQQHKLLPTFQHDDLGSVTNSVRNAMIYGTLCRLKAGGIIKSCKDTCINKKHSLITINDNKPSVWQQYYGVRAVPEGDIKYPTKPTDVPIYPGGRPEADFTLDLPRSEMLSKRMKQDKKWRCRCRLLTSFLGLVFFLLSVMAVSLMLTRGKRMFGSMM